MHQERSEERDTTGGHFERQQARVVVLIRIHFERTEAVDRAARLHTLAMTPRHDLEASVFDSGMVDEDHRRGDPCGDRRQIRPIWKILMENNLATLARALDVELFGEQREVIFADQILARIEKPRIEAPPMKLLAQMRERLDALHQLGMLGLPFDDGVEAALHLEHVAAEAMLGPALLALQPGDECLASVANRAQLGGIEDRVADHESPFVEFGAFASIESEAIIHQRFTGSC